MRQSTETDQPTILRLLVEQGVDGKIKPQHPNGRGAVAMFPDINTFNTWYIVDLLDGFYTVTILEDCTPRDACSCMDEYLRRFNPNQKVINGLLHVLKKPVPARN